MNQEANARKIMQHKAFRQPSFHNDKDKILELIRVINKIEIDLDTFKMIRILIRFFRFPVLILFQPIYKRIELQKEKYLYKYQEQLIRTAGLVKAIIKHDIFFSLQFYFKAGCSTAEIDLKEESDEEPYRRFILEVDNKLNQRERSDPFEEDKRLRSIQNYLKNQCPKQPSAVQLICIDQYLKIINFRRRQINKQIALQRQNQKQGQPLKLSPQVKLPLIKQKQPLILINGPQERSIEDNKIANDYLCCRPYFYQNEIINQPETLVQQYKNYEYPFDRFLGDILLKTICGFLNARGGIIYIGIREANETKKRVVVGQRYSQNAKQDLLKYFRVLCEKISPEIVNLQLYKLQFVPLKNPQRKNQFVPGRYVVRLRVEMGSQKELYSFRKSDGDQLFAFRTENQVLTQRIGQQILQLYRKKLTSNDERMSYIKHTGPCKSPEMGVQLCIADSKQSKIDLPWNNNNKSYYSNRNNPKKEKQESLMQPYQSPVFCSLPNTFADEFKKFDYKNGKQLYSFIEPKDQKQQQCIEIIIYKYHFEGKIKKISRLIELKNVQIETLEQLFEHILYTTFSGNRIGIKSYDEVLQATKLLQSQGIGYKFIFWNKKDF